MKKIEKYIMRFATLMFLIIGYFGLFYGTGENVHTGLVFCGTLGLMTWVESK